eukprot:UN11619
MKSDLGQVRLILEEAGYGDKYNEIIGMDMKDKTQTKGSENIDVTQEYKKNKRKHKEQLTPTRIMNKNKQP